MITNLCLQNILKLDKKYNVVEVFSNKEDVCKIVGKSFFSNMGQEGIVFQGHIWMYRTAYEKILRNKANMSIKRETPNIDNNIDIIDDCVYNEVV